MPANIGDDADVPPMRELSPMALAIPLAQLLAVPPVIPSSESGVQIMYPGKFGEAINETSGT
jgi:hypothetical protein